MDTETDTLLKERMALLDRGFIFLAVCNLFPPSGILASWKTYQTTTSCERTPSSSIMKLVQYDLLLLVNQSISPPRVSTISFSRARVRNERNLPKSCGSNSCRLRQNSLVSLRPIKSLKKPLKSLMSKAIRSGSGNQSGYDTGVSLPSLRGER